MESWDILDINGNKTGRVGRRGTLLKDGEYHLVVFIWIKNSEGKILISKRSEKKSGAGLWEVPGGSVQAGETSLAAALREVHEEVGIKLTPEKGTLIKRLRFDTTNSWFSDHWLFNHNAQISELMLQVEEVAEVKWLTKEEIIQLINKNQFFNGSIYLENILLPELV